MTLDLTQFHATFFEESFEALDTMEAALLKLDVGAPDPELINTIFRVAHSIKGGSATFGFSDIASFTHSLETLLDELRGGRMAVTAATSDLLLASVDLMREMLRTVQSKRPIDPQRIADVQLDIELAIAGKQTSDGLVLSPATASAVAARESRTYRWLINFKPFPELFARGNDPLRMLRELAQQGNLTVEVDTARLPEFSALDPLCCYLGWHIRLTGALDEAAVREVFAWAEGDCELEIRRDEAAKPTSPPPQIPIVQQIAPADKPETQPVGAIGETGSIRVSVEKIDELMNTVGELVITQAMLSQLGESLHGVSCEEIRIGLAQLERNMRELQESVMRVRMLPISFVFSRFPRMVRDLAQRLGKQIELKLVGENTELDKTVLEKIGDPLVHLVRNSIDHGIERPEVRLAAGKPASGTLRLDACHRGGNIAVEVSDDGAGLDKARILEKALARNLVSSSEALTDEQVYELIFTPGFSTAEQATDVSGRGVGLDVVRRNVRELGGKIELTSTYGRGARFLITLPLTLAIVDGQSIAVGKETYVVPLINIIESLQVARGSTNRISGRGDLFSFRGAYLPVIRLHELFGVPARARELHEGLIVIVEGDGRRAGLFVDDLLGQQQVVIKSLESNYGQVQGVSGATILGDGSVALILDIAGLIRRTSSKAAA